jgi:hypothetical protein
MAPAAREDFGPLRTVLVDEGIRWVLSEREKARNEGRPLFADEMRALGDYVGRLPCLNDVRIKFVRQLEDPPFLETLGEGVRERMIDFAALDAITFGDAIVVREDVPVRRAFWRSTLFHELVHVAQYAILGVEGFVREYVEGFLDHDFVYERIPLEVTAFALQERFERGEAFAIAREVARSLL